MTTRRIAAPWRGEKISGGYVVRDANGKALAYGYSGASEADARPAKVLTEDEAAPDRGEHCEAAGVGQARGLTMWWILFVHGVVVVIEASSLIHARTLAAP